MNHGRTGHTAGAAGRLPPARRTTSLPAVPPTPPDPNARRDAIVRALRRHRGRLARKLEALRGDMAEAERGPEYRRMGETLLVYLAQVPARKAEVVLPDPTDPARNLTIPLDPKLRPQDNAARYFKRAAKSERRLVQVPPRLAAIEAELLALEQLIRRAARRDEKAAMPEGEQVIHVPADETLEQDLEAAAAKLPPALWKQIPAAPGAKRASAGASGARGGAARGRPDVPARLQPRRLRTVEGWDVLIGRTNEGNDYLTVRIARPEDYWFHVHGAAGSHVVLRRGKGKNEPSKRTIEEVAAWAAFYSQARTAGRVPVIVTRKKYVRKPRKAPPGLVTCEREKTVMARPTEPPRSALASEWE